MIQVKKQMPPKHCLGQGCDVIAQHTDSPAPLQVAEQQGHIGFGQASDPIQICPKAQLTATIDNWGPYYIEKVGQVLDGTWTPGCDGPDGCYFGHMNDGSVGMAPIYKYAHDDVKAKAEEIKAAITAGEYFAFTGPSKIPSESYKYLQVKLLTESIQIV